MGILYQVTNYQKSSRSLILLSNKSLLRLACQESLEIGILKLIVPLKQKVHLCLLEQQHINFNNLAQDKLTSMLQNILGIVNLRNQEVWVLIKELIQQLQELTVLWDSLIKL